MSNDRVDHPSHYNSHPSGVECIDLSEHLLFNLGNAFKYVFRCLNKHAPKEDMEKALWYVCRERDRLACLEDNVFDAQLDSKFSDLIANEPDPMFKKLFTLIWQAEFGGSEYDTQEECLDAIAELLNQKVEEMKVTKL